MELEYVEKATKLSCDILRLSRNTLLVHLRFLDMALSILKLQPTLDIPFGSDGEVLYFEPFYVLKRYKVEKEAITRDYFHVVMHGVFRHMYIHTRMSRELWDLACDIAVENVINELDLRDVSASRQQAQTAILRKLQQKVNMLTAEKIYRYLMDQNLSTQDVQQMRNAFLGDDHSVWYPPHRHQQKRDSGEGASKQPSLPPNDGQRDALSNHSHTPMEEEWKKIAERMQLDMETFAKEKGSVAGGMTQNLREVNREKYDYAAFLKKFAVMGEALKINDDEFDYIFYTYGLKMYDKMPLVEPLEYKEVKRIKEFVIAIDTSGSVEGELVQAFVQKTYNVLKSTESFFSKINLHIIQCDAEIQETVKVTTQDEFDRFIKHMTIKGLGGTDFRPVFEHVNGLIAQKEFSNLKGLIYFTDGYGDFPAKKPDYDAAFVFINDQYELPTVPPWAIRLVLEKEEIL